MTFLCLGPPGPAITQDQLLEAIEQCMQEQGSIVPPASQLFGFWRPTGNNSNRNVMNDKLDERQMDVMYALGCCHDVGTKIGQVKKHVRVRVKALYGISDHLFQDWFKNRGNKTPPPPATVLLLPQPNAFVHLQPPPVPIAAPPPQLSTAAAHPTAITTMFQETDLLHAPLAEIQTPVIGGWGVVTTPPPNMFATAVTVKQEQEGEEAAEAAQHTAAGAGPGETRAADSDQGGYVQGVPAPKLSPAVAPKQHINNGATATGSSPPLGPEQLSTSQGRWPLSTDSLPPAQHSSTDDYYGIWKPAESTVCAGFDFNTFIATQGTRAAQQAAAPSPPKAEEEPGGQPVDELRSYLVNADSKMVLEAILNRSSSFIDAMAVQNASNPSHMITHDQRAGQLVERISLYLTRLDSMLLDGGGIEMSPSVQKFAEAVAKWQAGAADVWRINSAELDRLIEAVSNDALMVAESHSAMSIVSLTNSVRSLEMQEA